MNIKALTILSFFILSIFVQTSGQELECRVTVNTKVQSSVTRVYETMKDDILNFMNNRAWTNDRFGSSEKIKCNIYITIDKQIGTTDFEATIQVQSSRPVYNSSYSSPILNIRDNKFKFKYMDNTTMNFSPEQFRSNLTSVLAYYAYLIIGYDYDTFGKSAGNPYFLLAKEVVDKAQTSGSSGWKSSESDQNRYWIVENILNGQFAPFRECLYEYHRLGLDEMYNDPIEGRRNISISINKLLKVHRSNPASYNTQIFFKAKSDEIVGIYSSAMPTEKSEIYSILEIIDPVNLDSYNKLNN